MTSYAFDNAATAQSRQRFSSLQHCYDPTTMTRLTEIGIGRAWHCLEVGAGGGSIAEWLGRQVGERGSVTATDIDTSLIDVYGSNVEIRRHGGAGLPVPACILPTCDRRLTASSSSDW